MLFRSGLAEDVAAVRAVLAEGDEPTVVVAHSYGGIVTAEAAAGIGSVRHLLLVSSYLPEVGESLSTFGPSEPAPFLDVDVPAGTFGVRRELFADTFLQDCPEVADEAGRRLARQTVSVVGRPVRAAAWQQVPSTYLVCTQDRGTPAAAQRDFARRAGTVVELDAGHHPFLSQPRAVADLGARPTGLSRPGPAGRSADLLGLGDLGGPAQPLPVTGAGHGDGAGEEPEHRGQQVLPQVVLDVGQLTAGRRSPGPGRGGRGPGTEVVPHPPDGPGAVPAGRPRPGGGQHQGGADERPVDVVVVVEIGRAHV